MKVGVLGSGDVGQTLAAGFLNSGHETMLAARERDNEKIAAWQKSHPGGKTGSFADAASFAELIVLSTLGSAAEEAIRLAGIRELTGKIIIDTTNPLDFSSGFPPKLFTHGDDSLGERIQRLVPDARVVKCFNIVGNALMVHPEISGGPPTMFFCGNDTEAKRRIAELLHDWEWESSDIGGIECSRYLEALCMVWVLDASKGGNWREAFKMLRG